jgi:predicted dehydrogenase
MTPPRERPLGAAIVGTGFAAAAHIDALRRVNGASVVGVLGSSPGRSQEEARRLGVDRAYRSLEEVLADEAVDVVHNCTPNDLHHSVAVAALDAGKDLLSEKPLALDTAQAVDLVARARTADGVAGVCFNYRHYPLVQHLRMTLLEGAHGKVHLVHGGYLQDWLLYEDDWNWRLESRKAGPTRAVGDIGSHWIDLVQHVTGDDVRSVSARLERLHAQRWRPGEVRTFERDKGHHVSRERVSVDTEDMATVLLRFASGAIGACTVSQVSSGWKNRLFLEIDTATSGFVWDQEEPNRLRIGRRDGPNEVLVRDPSLLVPQAASLAHYPGGHEEGWPDGLRNLMIDFYAAVNARLHGEPYTSTFAPFGEAHRVARVVDAVLESDRLGSWVEVGSEVTG